MEEEKLTLQEITGNYCGFFTCSHSQGKVWWAQTAQAWFKLAHISSDKEYIEVCSHSMMSDGLDRIICSRVGVMVSHDLGSLHARCTCELD